MELPASTVAVAVLVALLVPGLIYSSVRASLTGYRGTDKSVSSRFAQAVTVGVLLNATYLTLLGPAAYSAFTFIAAREQVTVTHPFDAGRTVLLLGLATPVLLALLVHVVPWRRIPPVTRVAAQLAQWGVLGVSRVPTAWDQAGHQQSDVFVRITRADGSIVGGWYGRGSLMSGFPEGRDIFIAEQWSLNGAGGFDHRLEGTAGIWLAVRDDDILEWSRPGEGSE